MTHTDLGIDEATFAASLRVIGHPWHPGQRCKGAPWFATPCDHGVIGPHDISIPVISDELLMRMLREGLKRHEFFASAVESRLFSDDTGCRNDMTLEAAIIRATAALKTPAAPTSEPPK